MAGVGDTWVIVPAGGCGGRLRPAIREWLGEDRPKQYCTFHGRRSMLRRTWDRALRIAPAGRIVTVVSRDHSRFLEEEVRKRPLPGTILEQPGDRGTGPGIVLPLAWIRACQPGARVLILPSDHFADPEEELVRLAVRGLTATRRTPALLALLVARAEDPDADRGWVLPEEGAPAADGLRRVARFVDEPEPAEARRLAAAGGLVNTMICAGSAEALWRLASRRLAEVCRELSAVAPQLRLAGGRLAERSGRLLDAVYGALPVGDFSRDVLTASAEAIRALPLEGVQWNDWVRPEQVTRTLRALGLDSPFGTPDPVESPFGAPDPVVGLRRPSGAPVLPAAISAPSL